MSNSSSIQLTLGYANPSEDPDINAVLSRRSYVGDINDPNDIEASKQLELLDPDFDQNNDGFKHFLQLIDGETFTQTIEITNNGPSGTFTFDVDATNSQFSRLTDLEIADDMDGIFLPGETVQGLEHITVDGDRQTATITAHIGHGQTLKLNAVSTIDAGGFNENPDDDLDARELDFSLIDAPGVDFGTGDADGLIYLDPGGFDRFDGVKEGSGFSFDALADSTLSVNFYGEEVSQETQTLRGYAEYSGTDTTANDEGSLEREKTFFFFEHSGDVDTEWRFSPGGSRSDELSLNDFLRLLWINIPEFEDEINQYLATEDPLDAYNQLLSLIDLGITDEVLTTTELDGRVAEFIRSGGLNGEGGFTQPALSGDLGDGVPTPGVPDPGDSSVILGTDGNDRLKGTAEADLIFGFGGADRINGLDGNDIISGGDGLDHLNGNDGNDSIFGGYRTDRINGGAGDDLLSGDGGNDSVRGGAGDDLLLGVSGNDTLVGEAGSDTFVFGNGDGTDRINDFDPSEDFIGLIEGELIFADISLTQEGKNTILGVSSTGEELAVLVKVSADAISEDNFVTIADISNIDDAI